MDVKRLHSAYINLRLAAVQVRWAREARNDVDATARQAIKDKIGESENKKRDGGACP